MTSHPSQKNLLNTLLDPSSPFMARSLGQIKSHLVDCPLEGGSRRSVDPQLILCPDEISLIGFGSCLVITSSRWFFKIRADLLSRNVDPSRLPSRTLSETHAESITARCLWVVFAHYEILR